MFLPPHSTPKILGWGYRSGNGKRRPFRFAKQGRLAMLSSHNISAEMGSNYYQQENYYSDAEASFQSRWWGRGAERLRLTGQADSEDFKQLLVGNLPGGESFRQRRSTRSEYRDRAGLDLTFSAPKSVSLLALVFRDWRVVEAHKQAVDRVLELIERDYAETRVRLDGKRVPVRTENVVVAQFHHDTSRELDPQLHTHCVALNMTWANDKWYCLTNGRLYRDRKRLGMQYQGQLANRLEALGYAIAWKENGLFEVDGFSREQLQAFSKRRRQIEAEMKQTSWQACQTAALKTRQPKKMVESSELLNCWQEAARVIGIEIEAISQKR
ncbi:MAG: MobF family relaxase [Cyanobacteria bacterium J06642_2]